MMYVCNWKSGNHECDGCGCCDETPTYICPICGEEVYESVFVTNDGEVLGCDNCAHIKEPYEMAEAERQGMEDEKADADYEAWRDRNLEADYN